MKAPLLPHYIVLERIRKAVKDNVRLVDDLEHALHHLDPWFETDASSQAIAEMFAALAKEHGINIAGS